MTGGKRPPHGRGSPDGADGIGKDRKVSFGKKGKGKYKEVRFLPRPPTNLLFDIFT